MLEELACRALDECTKALRQMDGAQPLTLLRTASYHRSPRRLQDLQVQLHSTQHRQVDR